MASGGEVRVSLTLDDQLSGGLRQADAALIALTGSATQAMYALGRMAPALAGVAVAGLAMKGAIDAAAAYQTQLANLGAVMDATPAQLQKIGQAQLELSRQTIFTAEEIGKSSVILAKSGADANTIISEQKDVLNLAAATQSTATDATRLFVSAQKDFGLSTAASTPLVNTLSKAIDSSIGTVGDWQTAFKQVGPVLKATEQDTKLATATIADLMNAGLQGDAGTALKVFLQRIQVETPAAKRAIAELGLEFYNANGTMKQLPEIFDDIQQKTRGFTQQTRDSLLSTIFGTRGVRVADIAAQEGAGGINDVLQHMASNPDAADAAQKKLDTLAGSFHQLSSSLNVLAVQSGQAFSPLVRGIADGAKNLTDMLTGINSVNPAILQMVVGLGGVIAAIKLMNTLTNEASIRFGTMEQAISAGSNRVNDRAAQIAAYNEVSKGISYEGNLAAQTGKAGGIFDPTRQNMLLEQQDLLTRGTSSQNVQVYSDRQQQYLTALDTKARQEESYMEREAAASEKYNERKIAAESRYQTQLDEFNAKRAQQGLLPYDEAYRNRYANAPAGAPSEPVIEPYKPITPPNFINVPPKPRVTDVLAEGGSAGGGFGSLIPMLGGLLGEAMVLAMAKALIVDPITNQMDKAFAPKSFDAQGLKNQTSAAGAQDYAKNYITEQQKIVDSWKNKSGFEKFGATPGFGLPLIGGEAPGEKNAKIAQQNIDEASKSLDGYMAKNDAWRNSLKQGVTDDFGNVVQQVKDGTVTLGEAQAMIERIAQGTKDAQQYFPGDVQQTAESIDKQAATTKRQIEQTALQNRLQQESEDAMNKAADDRKALLRQLNVPQNIITGDSQNDKASVKYADNTIAAYRKQNEDVKRYLTDTAKASTDAGAAIGKIDFTKGFLGLEKAIPDLEKLTMDLRQLGQDSAPAEKLLEIGKAFKSLSDKFEGSSSMVNFRGNNAMLAVTDQQISMLDSYASKVQKVAQVAQEAKAHNIATPDQLELLNSENNILDQVSKQIRGLYANEATDVLNIAKDLPDLVAYNNEIRALAKSFGGVANVQGVVEEQAKRATSSVADVKTITKEMAEHPDAIRLMIDPQSHADVIKDIDNMHGDLTKLNEHDWQVIVQAVMGNSIEALTTLQGILAAVPNEKSIRVSIQNDIKALDYASHNNGIGVEDINASIATKQAQVATITMKPVMDEGAYNDMIANASRPIDVPVHMGVGEIEAAAAKIRALNQDVVVHVSVSSDFVGPLQPGAERDHPYIQPYVVTPNGTPNPPAGGDPTYNRANGGQVPGDWAIVGDTPSGDMSAAELVDFKNRRVVSHKDAVRMGMLSGSYPRYAEGIDATQAVGDPYTGDRGWGKIKGVDFQSVTDKAVSNLRKIRGGVGEVQRAVIDLGGAAENLGTAFSGLNGIGLKDIGLIYNQISSINKKGAEGLLPLNATKAQKDEADAGATEKSVNQTAAVAGLMVQISQGGQVNADQWKVVEESLGAIGPLIHQQVVDYATIAANNKQIAYDQAQLKENSEMHQKQVASAQIADQAWQRSHEDKVKGFDMEFKIQDRMYTQGREHIQDLRTKEQRRWEDATQASSDQRKMIEDNYKLQSDAIKEATQAENDRWVIESRNLEDAKQKENDRYTQQSRATDDQTRFLNFWGTQTQKNLQDQLTMYEKQYTMATALSGAQERLVQSQVKGAQTNEQASSFASSLSLMKEQDSLAKKQMDTQKTAIQQAIDDQKILATQQKYDLETQKVAEQRVHEDNLKAIDNQSKAETRTHEDTLRHLQETQTALQKQHDLQIKGIDDTNYQAQKDHNAIMRQWSDEDTKDQRLHEQQQWIIQDLQTAWQTEATDHQRLIQDTSQQADKMFNDTQIALNNEIQDRGQQNTQIQTQVEGINTILGIWGQLQDAAGNVAQTLLGPLTAMLSASGFQAPAIPNPHARGGVLRGISLVGEGGPELVYGDGVALSAGDTIGIMASVMKKSSGTTVVAGDRHYHIYQQPGESTDVLVAKVEALEEKFRKQASEDQLANVRGGPR